MQNTQPNISADVPDWSREDRYPSWAPAKRVVDCVRRYQRYNRSSLPHLVIRMWCVFSHRIWSAFASCDIPINAQISGGFILRHSVGVVIHPKARIGPNCAIFQNVTLVGGVVLEGNVEVGAGAKIIKPVTVGANSVIGANAVVNVDVPANSIAVGVPVRIFARPEIIEA